MGRDTPKNLMAARTLSLGRHAGEFAAGFFRAITAELASLDALSGRSDSCRQLREICGHDQ